MSTPPATRELRVLLVEDSEDDALLIQRALIRGGYKIVSDRVQTERDLRDRLLNGKWNLAISDFHMPEFSGPRALSVVRELAPDLPFVAVSGHLSEERIVEAMRDGVHDYLLKSNLTRLVPAVERALVEHENIRARRLLEDQLLLLRAAAESVGDGMLITSVDAASPAGPVIAYVNRTMEILTGYSREEFIGRSATFPFGPDPDRQLPIRNALVAKAAFEGNSTLHRKDGSAFEAEWRGCPVAGAASHAVLVIRDVTDIRRQEKLQTELQRQLSVAQKMDAIGRLTSGIAHDFNNLLVVINGHAQLLNSELRDRDPSAATDVLNILRAGERAAELTRRLLTFSRNQAEVPRVLSLNSSIAEMEKLLRRLIREDVVIQKKLAPDLQTVRGDPSQMDQILLNLAVNASDAMTSGGVLTIETRNEAGRIVLEVSDTGHGMSSEVQSRIFEPFFTTKEPGKGTGLGLPTVYGIVHGWGGEIEVNSREGSGTTFTIRLPAHQKAAPEETATLPVIRGGKETILVVEDQAEVRKLTARVLRGYGYTVIEAGDGLEAFGIIEKGGCSVVDLLVTDVVMPQMSGFQLAARLRDFCPRLRVLFVSGHVAEVTAGLGVDLSAVNFLRKPYDLDELARQVRSVLDLPGGGSQR